ncbi:hypothetical protein LC613_19030 [Nostoc sphaeroides CHAB 2801]|uniref:DUF6745 domain-containing protein n=1 Tax=Nostoc sphaeroides TaxID=446679 RepID=UPI000E547DE3|nr:hypothetical protein [Nostoc sphaeroides]MCC5630017.1 hypothetical protein [Nostoc sphaeroides CHAB 2801]
MSLIEKLTPEQEALIPVYRQKWRAIALSTERIDREKAAEAVKAAYIAIDFGYEKPEIFFQDSPYAACNWMLKRLSPEFLESYLNEPNSLGGLFSAHFSHELSSILNQQLGSQQLDNCFYRVADDPLNHEIYNNLSEKFSIELNEQREDFSWWIKIQLNDCFKPESHVNWMTGFDYCISVLNIVHPQQEWKIFQSLIQECGWLFAYDDICIICDRPLHLRFDNENRLHAEGEPAIEFIDGYSLYSYHGVTLPEKYGKIHPQQWQAQWLLTEENAELRRVLIQGIGYARICQELQAIELDTWQEYTLLKIDADVDQEPIYLLKMTCPSTGFIHALRVPPNMNSAREAISWVNWGVDPEEFAVQT